MKNRLKTFIAKWGTALSFLLLAGAGMYAVSAQASSNAQTLYRTQLAGCERANKVRAESNDRINAHVLERNVLGEFLESAAQARRAAGTETDIKAANKYLALKYSLRRVHFTAQPLIDCQKTVEKP